MKMLDTTSFENVITSLNSILARYAREHDNDIRDAVIQRFEYTYSLAVKMITRFINLQANEEVATMTFNETISIANKIGILCSDLVKWTTYRQMRNATSHTYDETVANEVLSVIPDFRDEVEFLLKRLKELI